MIKNQINEKYSRWHYHYVLEILQKKFTESHILVIKPSRMHRQMYSCYDHFLHCDTYGNPDYKDNDSNCAIDHLEAIILNSTKVILVFVLVHLFCSVTNFDCTLLRINDNIHYYGRKQTK